MDINHKKLKLESLNQLKDFVSCFLNEVDTELLYSRSLSGKLKFQEVFLDILYRISLNISSIDTLLEKFIKKTHFKLSIGLLIRTSLLDSITIVYLNQFLLKYGEIAILDELARFNVPVIKQIQREIEEEAMEKRLSKAEINEMYLILAKIFPENVINSTKIVIKKLRKVEVVEMKDFIEKTDVGWFSSCYKFYQYYSNYEHFSSTSTTFLNYHPEFDFDKLTMSLYHILYACFQGLAAINRQPVIIEKYNKLESMFVNFYPTFKLRVN
ncbi:MAG: hypothetical protein NT004_01640 [Bacteroidetes bacterium]|nr:hypothetical protein [Bacteroidota bacterium]